MNTQYQNFGEFLQRKRSEKSNHAPQGGGKIGITAPYLTDIEKDRRNPPEMEKLELISQILMLNDEVRLRCTNFNQSASACLKVTCRAKRADT